MEGLPLKIERRGEYIKIRKTIKMAALLCAAVIFAAGCGSVQSGVREGISGLFRSGGGSDDRGRAAGGCGAPFSGAEDGGGSRSADRGTGEAVTVNWPSDDEWDAYGLKGLARPAGSTVTNVALYQGTWYVGMADAGREAYDGLVAQIKKITGTKNPL
jgi:hypothetical protein